jgi:hypothetical protein
MGRKVPRVVMGWDIIISLESLAETRDTASKLQKTTNTNRKNTAVSIKYCTAKDP